MKRKRSAHVGGKPPKRARGAVDQSPSATTADVEHPVLSRLYPHVTSLRQYLLSRLPTSSKSRRRKLGQLGLQHGQDATTAREIDVKLGNLLDSVVVGVLPSSADAAVREKAAQERERDLESFSQQLPAETTAGTFKPGYFLQSEVGSFEYFGVTLFIWTRYSTS
jgi:hypothetical protein